MSDLVLSEPRSATLATLEVQRLSGQPRQPLVLAPALGLRATLGRAVCRLAPLLPVGYRLSTLAARPGPGRGLGAALGNGVVPAQCAAALRTFLWDAYGIEVAT